MTTGRKLAVAGLVVAGVTGYMAYLGASASWQYYLTVDECLDGVRASPAERIRVSGKIAAASLSTDPDSTQVTFSLEGTHGNLPIVCAAAPPDKLTEQMEVVVEGRREASGRLRAEKVLTRCTSKYQSRSPSAAAESNISGVTEGSG